MKKKHLDKFNSVYRRYDDYYGIALRPEFIHYFSGRDCSGMDALDLGCGEGRYAIFLAELGARVTAVDRSPVAIEKLSAKAKQKGLAIEAVNADIADFDFAANAYDIIVAATILDHLPQEILPATAARIKSALKSEGILYVNVFTVLDPGYLQHHAQAPANSTYVSDTADCMEHYFQCGELRNLFEEFDILFDYEGVEPDLSHGAPHDHGWACLLARKSSPPPV